MIRARSAGVIVGATLLAAALTAAAGTDTSPPAVRLNHGAVFTVGSVLSDATGNAAVPVTLTWQASDDSAVTRQHAHWESTDSNFALSATGDEDGVAARQVTGVPYYPNGSLYATVDAYDAAGNLGSDTASYFGQLVQSDRFTRSADWTSVGCRLCFSERATLRTTTAGASMQYQFTGRSIALVGDYAGTGGSFEVYIDGVRQGTTYSEHGTAKKMAVVFQKRFATRATHVLGIVAASGRVDVDALVAQTASCRC
jgi:hypothetical protein